MEKVGGGGQWWFSLSFRETVTIPLSTSTSSLHLIPSPCCRCSPIVRGRAEARPSLGLSPQMPHLATSWLDSIAKHFRVSTRGGTGFRVPRPQGATRLRVSSKVPLRLLSHQSYRLPERTWQDAPHRQALSVPTIRIGLSTSQPFLLLRVRPTHRSHLDA